MDNERRKINMNTQTDWNIADDLPENERLYVRVIHWTGDSDLLIPATTTGTNTLLPANWIDGAYTLADAGDSVEGWEMLRLPNGMRVSVMSSYLEYYTKVNPEKIYKTHLELDHMNPFQFKDTSSASPQDEEIVPEAPEWLNNLCNRIDALEAEVEKLSAWTINAHEVIEEALEDYDLNAVIENATKSRFADLEEKIEELDDDRRLKYEVTAIVNDVIDDHDFSDAVQNEIDGMDFKEMVQDEIKNFDLKNIVMSVLSEPEFVQSLAQAMNPIIRQQVAKQLHATPSTPEYKDAYTGWKRGKGWR
jgi:hypothetical protein